MLKPMKVLSLILLVQNLAAQDGYEIFKFSSDPIITTKNVPAGFKIFVPDSAAQLVINPARVVSSKFVYTTYYPGASTDNGSVTENPVYSINYYNKYGLIRLETSPVISEFTESENINSDNPIINNFDSIVRNSDDLNIKLSMIDYGKTKSISYAVGFTGIIGLVRTDSKSDNELLRYNTQFIDDKEYILETSDNGRTQQDDSNKGYLLGMIVGVSKDDWEWVSSFNFQELNINHKLLSRSHQSNERVDLIDGVVTTYFQFQDISNGYKIKDSPSIFNVKSLWRKKNLFMNLNVSYAFDSQISYSYERTATTRISPLEDETGSTESQSVSGTFSPGFFEPVFSFGYVFSKELKDLFFFTGLSPSIRYLHWNTVIADRYSPSPGSLANENIKVMATSFITPIYLRYNIKKGFAFTGGLNFSASYNYYRLSYNTIKGLGSNLTTGGGQKSKFFSTTREIYFGASLKHKSGLAANFDFNGDITRVTGWNVALGYYF